MSDIDEQLAELQKLLDTSNASFATYTADQAALGDAVQELIDTAAPPEPIPPDTIPVLGPNWIQNPSNFAARGWACEAATTLANQGGPSLDGTDNLSTITDDATNHRHIFYQNQLNPNNAGNYIFSVYLKQGTLRHAQLSISDANAGGFFGAVFDLQTGEVTDTNINEGTLGSSASIVATAVSGLYLASITMDVAAGPQNVYAQLCTSNSATPTYEWGNPTYAGSNQYIYAWNASLRMLQGTASTEAPWITAGYLVNTFHVDIFDDTNVDMKLTRNSGFQFYLNGTTFYPDTLPSHVSLNADGSVTLTGSDIGDGIGSATISSVGCNQGGDVTDWKGTAFGGGAYFEATLSFDPNTINEVNGAGGLPAWWADPVEHIAESSINSDNWKNQPQWFVHFTELDFFEYNVWEQDGCLYTYNGTVIDWSGKWTGSNYPVVLQNTYNRRIQLPPATDFTQPHRYGFLWVPATATTPGYFQWFFDGLPTSARVTYDYYDPINPPSPPAEESSPWLYGVADGHHYQLFLNPDGRGSLTVHALDVWQASSAGNIVK
jgi:hypothetical protein